MEAFLADTIAVVHAAFVLFVVGGLVLVLLGAALRWGWVRNPWFRGLHLVAIVVVALEAMFGVTCPLTVWERELLEASGRSADQRSFMARLSEDLLYLDLPAYVFPILHVGFAVLVVLAFVLVPPRRKRAEPDADAPS